jgi:hypothetical protein
MHGNIGKAAFEAAFEKDKPVPPAGKADNFPKSLAPLTIASILTLFGVLWLINRFH